MPEALQNHPVEEIKVMSTVKKGHEGEWSSGVEVPNHEAVKPVEL